MYTRTERGIEAAWLRKNRKARWSNVHKAIADFEAETGHHIGYSTWASYESGKRTIPDDDMDALVAFFGSGPAYPSSEPGGDLAAAIREQAAAIDRLAAALERDREDAPAWADAVVRAVLAGHQLSRADRERVER
jgi:hypothetical protein